MVRVFEARRQWLRIVLGIGVASVVTMLSSLPLVARLPSYPLFYSFEIPLALPGLLLADEGTQKTYTGALRGSLGGLPLRAATYTYGTHANKLAGGGTFSLTTAAGTTRDGQILMTTDREAALLRVLPGDPDRIFRHRRR